MATNEVITCIFCLEQKPPSVEHVMPKALGGNLTITCVCQKCNTGLSDLDQSLVESSILTLIRLMEQPGASSATLARLGADTEMSAQLEIKLGAKFQSEMRTQLIFRPGAVAGAFEIRGSASGPEAYKDFFEILRKQIAKRGTKSIKILSAIEGNFSEMAGFRLIQNQSDQVAFRPSSIAETEREFSSLVTLLESKLSQIEELVLSQAQQVEFRNVEMPEVIANLHHDFGRNLRAASKIAYTFLAWKFGAETVCDSKFSALRNYVKSGLGADDQGAVWWNGDDKEKSLGSTRYALWMPNYHEHPVSFGKGGVHTLALTNLPDRQIAIIEFYGQQAFSVDLGNAGLAFSFPIVQEFDFVHRTNRTLSESEVFHRGAERLRANWKNGRPKNG